MNILIINIFILTLEFILFQILINYFKLHLIYCIKKIIYQAQNQNDIIIPI
jgi:hypothetical protein